LEVMEKDFGSFWTFGLAVVGLVWIRHGLAFGMPMIINILKICKEARLSGQRFDCNAWIFCVQNDVEVVGCL
jgi:hypothetical protein